MSIPFFNDVLAALGKKLNYETVSNLYGNAFAKDAGQYISEAHPLIKHSKLGNKMLSMMASAPVMDISKMKQMAQDSKGNVQNGGAIILPGLGDITGLQGVFD